MSGPWVFLFLVMFTISVVLGSIGDNFKEGEALGGMEVYSDYVISVPLQTSREQTLSHSFHPLLIHLDKVKSECSTCSPDDSCGTRMLSGPCGTICFKTGQAASAYCSWRIGVHQDFNINVTLHYFNYVAIEKNGECANPVAILAEELDSGEALRVPVCAPVPEERNYITRGSRINLDLRKINENSILNNLGDLELKMSYQLLPFSFTQSIVSDTLLRTRWVRERDRIPGPHFTFPWSSVSPFAASSAILKSRIFVRLWHVTSVGRARLETLQYDCTDGTAGDVMVYDGPPGPVSIGEHNDDYPFKTMLVFYRYKLKATMLAWLACQNNSDNDGVMFVGSIGDITLIERQIVTMPGQNITARFSLTSVTQCDSPICQEVTISLKPGENKSIEFSSSRSHNSRGNFLVRLDPPGFGRLYVEEISIEGDAGYKCLYGGIQIFTAGAVCHGYTARAWLLAMQTLKGVTIGLRTSGERLGFYSYSAQVQLTFRGWIHRESSACGGVLNKACIMTTEYLISPEADRALFGRYLRIRDTYISTGLRFITDDYYCVSLYELPLDLYLYPRMIYHRDQDLYISCDVDVTFYPFLGQFHIRVVYPPSPILTPDIVSRCLPRISQGIVKQETLQQGANVAIYTVSFSVTLYQMELSFLANEWCGWLGVSREILITPIRLCGDGACCVANGTDDFHGLISERAHDNIISSLPKQFPCGMLDLPSTVLDASKIYSIKPSQVDSHHRIKERQILFEVKFQSKKSTQVECQKNHIVEFENWYHVRYRFDANSTSVVGGIRWSLPLQFSIVMVIMKRKEENRHDGCGLHLSYSITSTEYWYYYPKTQKLKIATSYWLQGGQQQPRSWVEAEAECQNNDRQLITAKNDFTWRLVSEYATQKHHLSGNDQIKGNLMFMGIKTMNGSMRWQGYNSPLIYRGPTGGRRETWGLSMRYRCDYPYYQYTDECPGPDVLEKSTFDDVRHLRHVAYPGGNEEDVCGAIVLFGVLQVNWVQVNCSQTFDDTVLLCEDRSEESKIEGNHSHAVIETWGCPEGWVALQDHCLKLRKAFSMLYSKCPDAYSSITFFETSLGSWLSRERQHKRYNSKFLTTVGEVLYFYIQQWIVESPDRIYRPPLQMLLIEGEACARFFMYDLHMSVTYFMEELPQEWSHTDNHVLDYVLMRENRTVRHNICLLGDFVCKDGRCVIGSRRCDTNIDCPDGSDEINCDLPCESREGNVSLHYCRHTCRPEKCICKILYFQCENGGCIPSYLALDGMLDCPDGSDENPCYVARTAGYTQENSREQCDYGYLDLRTPHSQKTVNLGTAGDPVFICGSGNHIPLTKYRDLVEDCDLKEDETGFFEDLRHPSASLSSLTDPACSLPDHTTCIKGYKGKCYPMHKVCHYEKDDQGEMAFCRDGSHLQMCLVHQCPNSFKCTDSFCIPFHMICDGHPDCPAGEDEAECASLMCPGLLWCPVEKICVHPHQRCDNRIECLLSGDDEKDCGQGQCPSQSLCLGSAYVCPAAAVVNIPESTTVLVINDIIGTLDDIDFTNLDGLLILNLSSVFTSVLRPAAFRSLHSLICLDLSHNKISALQTNTFLGLRNVIRLDLAGNSISNISSFTFAGMALLGILDLSNQSLLSLYPYAFYGLHRLKILRLDRNRITEIGRETLHGLTSLEFLNIDGNNILALNFHVDSLSQSLSLRALVAADRVICCMALVENCKPVKTAGFSSCHSMIGSVSLAYCCRVLAVTGLVSTLCAMIWHVRRLVVVKNIHNIMMVVLALSELLISVYAASVVVVSLIYESSYLKYDHWWRQALACKVLIGLSCSAYGIVLFTNANIAVYRYLGIVHVSKPDKAYGSTFIQLIAGGIICYLVFPIIPISRVGIFKDMTHSSGPLCNVLDTGNKYFRWLVVFGWLCMWNGILMCVVLYSTVRTVQKLRSVGILATCERSTAARLRASRNSILRIMSPVLSWSLTFLLVLMSLAIPWLGADLFQVAFFFVLVMHSNLSPFLHTFSSTHFIAQLSDVIAVHSKGLTRNISATSIRARNSN